MVTSLVVGFALGLLSAVLKSRWDERRADRRKRRMVARALIPNLIEIRSSMIGLGDPIKWDSVVFPQHEWSKYRDDLADIRSAREWTTISGVFEEVESIRQETERYQWPDELSDLDVERLEDLYQNVRRALDVLHPYAGTSKPPRRVRRIRHRHRLRQRLRSLGLA